MIFDTSAIMAILRGEPEQELFVKAIDLMDSRAMSAVTLVEASMLTLSRRGNAGTRALDLFLAKAQIDIIQLTRNRHI